jgi:hypothetical protein
VLRRIAAAAAVTLSAILAAACGGPGAPLGPPSAQDVLAKYNTGATVTAPLASLVVKG